ncbi:glycosyltransferase family 9 protein [bacterium]|nr:glycosyltransferase family 9 protein [bacterium]
MEKINKILAINFGGIGDEILFLPTLISLKKEFPSAKITLALEPRSKSIKDLTNIIDELILVDIKNKNKYIELFKLIIKARFGGFDLAITAGGNKFMSIILWLTGIKKRYGYNTGKLSQQLLTFAVPLNKNQYAAKMYHDLVSPITDFKTELPQINIEQQEKIPNSILVHPGVSKISIQKGMIKTVTPRIWADTINLLLEKGNQVILAGGPDDEECISEILKHIHNNKFTNMYGKTKSLRELAELIGKAEKFLCSDSAPLHVAVAMGTETYAIFGPTDDKKLVPPNVTAIKVDDGCPLKPCLWERRQTTCKELSCLKITAENIINKIL